MIDATPAPVLGHFIKASGLRWVSLMLLAPIPWAGRVWALPVLAPSERAARKSGRRHKLLTDWARQMLIQVARWLPERRVIVVADMSYAAIELLEAVRRHLTVITRLRPACSIHRQRASPGRRGGRGSLNRAAFSGG